MTVAVVLAAYGVLAALCLPRLLRRAAWADRAPRLAIAMWLAAGASVIASAVLSALAVAVPAAAVGHGLAELFAACAALLGDETALGSAGARAGLAVSGLLLVRVAAVGASVLFGARRERRRHAAALSPLGRHDLDLDALVVDYDECLAYCLPGRKGHAVITTGALRSLAPEQVAVVLAHERAHLRGRHHLLLAAAETPALAFPRLPLFEQARAEVARLVELLADDVAARRHQRIHLATALVRLATGKTPAFALGAGARPR
ncbi:M56 family metallopeptidase [Nonomuraea antimicrobica]